MTPLTRVVAGVYDRPRLPLLLLLLLVMMSGLWASRFLTLDVSMEGLLGQETADFRAYRGFVELFGNDEGFTVAARSPNFLTEAGLRKLDRLHRDLSQNVPGVAKVTSLINTPLVREQDGAVLLATAFDPWPQTPDEFDQRLQAFFAAAPQQSELLSADRQTTLLMLTLQGSGTAAVGPAQYHQIMQQIEVLIQSHNSADFNVEVLGQAAFLGVLHAVLLRDIYLLPAAALGISILALFLMFRRRSGVVLPVLALAPPLVITMGAIGRSHIPIQLPTVLIPPSLIVIGIATCVHIMTAFYDGYGANMDKRSALLRAFERKGHSIIMTTLTTAIAMLSFATASVSPIARIGVFGAAGTAMLLLSITVVAPLYVRFVPLRPLAPGRNVGGWFAGSINTAIRLASRLAARHAGAISMLAVVGLVLSAGYATRLSFTHQPADWLPADWSLSVATKRFDRDFRAAISAEILLDSGKPGGVRAPEFMQTVAAVRGLVDQWPIDAVPHGLVLSPDDHLQRVAASLQAFFPTPQNANNAGPHLQRDLSILQLVAPELLSTVISADQRYARVQIRMPLRDGADYKPVMAMLEAGIHERVAMPYRATLTGQVPILAKTHSALTQSAFSSYLLSFLAILSMMVIHVRSLRDGLVAMIPNLLPVTLVLAGMQWVGLSLDMLSMLVVSISMGLVVDDTIHFLGDFHRHLKVSGDAQFSARQALMDSGRAMFITTMVLVVGWQMLFLSQFEKVTLFGNLTSLIMALGLAADFVVAPALMIWLYRERNSTSMAPCPPDHGGAVA